MQLLYTARTASRTILWSASSSTIYDMFNINTYVYNIKRIILLEQKNYKCDFFRKQASSTIIVHTDVLMGHV